MEKEGKKNSVVVTGWTFNAGDIIDLKMTL